MDRTSAQPQVNLSLLRSNSLKFQPLELDTHTSVLHTVPIAEVKERSAYYYALCEEIM
jgi:hypothetical protein